ncbi:MAG: PEP-CTERM sorting domain-containing protein, partial [Planctomycetota bacterium]
DYELSDLNTLRLFQYTSVSGTFFTTLGDADDNGTLDVLQGDGLPDDGAPGAEFIDTGVAMPLAANLGIAVDGDNLSVLVDGVSIFDGLILGADDGDLDAGDASTGILFPSGNDADGLGSTITIDNLSLSTIPEPASLGLLGMAGLALVRRRR